MQETIQQKPSIFKNQVIPVSLTLVVCLVLTGLLWLEITLLNRFTDVDVVLHVRWYDVLIGATIYIKTAIDFAIYIGNLMEKNHSWQSRIAIEIGTAVGNALGTMGILLLWIFFKEVTWLLAIMIFVAALVLFKLAEDGLQHAKKEDGKQPLWFRKLVNLFEKILRRINALTSPILKFIVPHFGLKNGEGVSFWPLMLLAFTVPFLLGLDDFAGYVPLFTIVNVFGFSIGVFVAHMILNIMLYISPKHTVAIVKNSFISFAGSIFFVVLGVWGIVEVVKLFTHTH